MKKTYLICIILAVLVLLLGVGGFVMTGQYMETAEQLHGELYDRWQDLRQTAERTTLTVTEEGGLINTYTLADLGLLDQTLAVIDGSFSDTERMTPQAFGRLNMKEQLDWAEENHSTTFAVLVDPTAVVLDPILADLDSVTRHPAEDAYVEFQDGNFVVFDEVYGTQLDQVILVQALRDSLDGLVLDGSGPQALEFEVTDHNCYIQPQETAGGTLFDYSSMLDNQLKHLSVTVDFHGVQETLAYDQLKKIVMVSDKGNLFIKDDVLKAQVKAWAETHQKRQVPYRLDSYVGGLRHLDILTADYYVDQAPLCDLLEEQLLELQPIEETAPWVTYVNGDLFKMNTFVEVDKTNQTMTYWKDGEVFVTTPVVTGNTWGYPTPAGFYKVENKDEDCWLSGEDYNVFVDYWVGFIGHIYGLHDADWRSNFGGKFYVQNGSHGCVNTPKEHMVKIYEDIEIGTPVLVYDVPNENGEEIDTSFTYPD